MRVAKEVDAMMWDIANAGDFHAIENFKKQFPDLHGELSRRVLLVKDLRKAKSLTFAPFPRPPFVPKAKVRHHLSWPALSAVAVSFAVIAAVGSLEAVDRYKAESYGNASGTRTGFIVSTQIQQAIREHRAK